MILENCMFQRLKATRIMASHFNGYCTLYGATFQPTKFRKQTWPVESCHLTNLRCLGVGWCQAVVAGPQDFQLVGGLTPNLRLQRTCGKREQQKSNLLSDTFTQIWKAQGFPRKLIYGGFSWVFRFSTSTSNDWRVSNTFFSQDLP